MEYFSLFSGIGGFELGIQKGYVEPYESEHQKKNTKCGHCMDIRWNNGEARCIGYSEINKYANEIYKKHFPEHKNYGNATEINTKELPYFDFLVAGFPCQTFSYAGRRKGFDDARGTLFFEIARVLKNKRPRYFLLENVKGLLSHDNGKTIQKMFGVLTDLRYQFEWQVLNSKDFGVPQSRERIFIVGYSGQECRPKIFPIGESKTIHHKKNSGKRKEGKRFQSKITSTIDARYGSLRNAGETYLVEGMQIRRLTPIECERLQGFPDNWTEGISDSQRYKCIGNAVTVNVVEAIVRKLTEVPNSSQG